MLDADGSQAEHNARDETNSNPDPCNDIWPADVKGGVVTKKLRPGKIEFETFVVHLQWVVEMNT